MLHVVVPILTNLSFMLDVVLSGSVGVAGLMVMLELKLKLESVMEGYKIPMVGFRSGSKVAAVFREGDNRLPVK